MLFPDQSPLLLLVVLVGLLALALFAASRDLLGGGGRRLCPKCGLAFDARTWTSHNERELYHGRYTITPHYTCPRCGTVVTRNSA
jgi:predicted RNA-binding Zn-ribbon protein involved in translation (DUF1610 family)